MGQKIIEKQCQFSKYFQDELNFFIEKQKKGKRRMKAIGNVHIPQSAFLSILEQGE